MASASPDQAPNSTAPRIKLDWSNIHESYFGLDCQVTYRGKCIANIMRAMELEVDNQLDETLAREAFARLTVPEATARTYDQLSCIHDSLVLAPDEDSTTGSLSKSECAEEAWKAWQEPAFALREASNNRWNSIQEIKEGHNTRLRHYPIQVSVDGAVTVGIPMLNLDELPGPTADISQELSFFDPSGAKAQRDGGGNLQLHLPVLLIKHPTRYKRKAANERSSIATENEQRIATASAAYFLARLGIKDFPIFGLVTSTRGRKGYLSQAWFSEKDDCCYVADCSIKQNPFDIETEEGVDRYKAFLSKLKDHAKELEGHFEAAREQLLARVMGDEAATLRWSTRAQLAEYEEARRARTVE